MNKIPFEDGQLVSPAYVKEDGTIEEAVYEGNTPLSSFNLNKMQDNIETAIEEKSSLPTGGTTGQILEKKSNEDNDVGWVDNTGGVTGDTLPIGSVVEFASDNNVPANWLLCNGQEVSRTEYALLFAVIGTTWGEGDGSTTFNVPTKEGLVTVGKKSSDEDFNTLGKTGGEKTHTLTVDEMPSHNHNISYPNAGGNYTAPIAQVDAATTDKSWGAVMANTQKSGNNQPHNNLQPYVTSNFIIKAKQSAGLVATVAKQKVESDNDTYSCNYINDKNSGITISLKEAYTILVASAYEKLPLTESTIIGNKLSIEENGIKVGSGISKVRVSGVGKFETVSAGQKYATLFKNGVSSIIENEAVINNERKQIVIPPFLLSVTEGDILDLRVYGTNGDVIRAISTYLTVEVVE